MKKLMSLLLAMSMLMVALPTALAAEIDVNEEEIELAAYTADPDVEKICFSGIGYCTGDGVRVRTGPGTNYRALGQFYKGDTLNLYSVKVTPTPTNSDWGDWLYVTGYSSEDEHYRGFIHGDYYKGEEPASVDFSEAT